MSFYQELNQIKDENTYYNLYGIVYDASKPSTELKNKNDFSTILKVLSPNLNFLNEKDFQLNSINIIIKSNKISLLPFVAEIGSIIRVINGYYKPRNKRNLYVNLSFNSSNNESSWVLFENRKSEFEVSHKPISYSKYPFIFDSEDSSILNYIKEWSSRYFSMKNSIFYEKEIRINEIFSKSKGKPCVSINGVVKADGNKNNKNEYDNDNEYDLCLLVCNKTEKKSENDEISCFYQCIDQSNIIELVILNEIYCLSIGDLIRIRSFQLESSSLSSSPLRISLKPYSSILIIPKYMKYYKENVKNIKEIMEFNKKHEFILNNSESYMIKCISPPKNKTIPIKSYNELTFLQQNPNESYIIHTNLYIKGYSSIENEYVKKDKSSNYYYSIVFYASFHVDDNFCFSFCLETIDNEGNGFIGISLKGLNYEEEYNKYLFFNKLDCYLSNLVDVRQKCEVYLRVFNKKSLKIVGEYNNLS